MSNTTALETWGAARAGGEPADDGERVVAERDISGGEDADPECDDTNSDDAPADESMDSGAQGGDPEAEMLAAKRKKDMRTFKIAGAVVAALIAGAAGYALLGANKTGEVTQPQSNAAQQVQVDDGRSPLVASAAPGQGGNALIIEQPDAFQSTPAADAMPAPTVAMPANIGLPPEAGPSLAPVVAPVVATPNLHVVDAAPMAPAKQARQTQPSRPVAVSAAADASEVANLRTEVASLRSDLSDSARLLSEAREELNAAKRSTSARLAVVRSPAPKRIEPKAALPEPASSIRETVIAAAAPALAPALNPVVAKSKSARTDYRIYAVVDGRVYLMGPDGETVQVAARSPLADGSRVTNIDTEKHVVYTSAGEIR